MFKLYDDKILLWFFFIEIRYLVEIILNLRLPELLVERKLLQIIHL